MPPSTTPFTDVHFDLTPGRTVLVVIDAQNDFLHNEGWYATKGIDISHMQRCIEPLRTLLGDARRKSIPVVWTRHGMRGPADGGVFMRLRPFLAEGGLRVGTWGFEVLDDLEPQADDWYVEKTRLSAFYCTTLEVVPAGARGGHRPVHRGTDESVRGRHHQGRDVSRLQADRGGGVHGDDPPAPTRSRHRDDAGGLGRGARPRVYGGRDPPDGVSEQARMCSIRLVKKDRNARRSSPSLRIRSVSIDSSPRSNGWEWSSGWCCVASRCSSSAYYHKLGIHFALVSPTFGFRGCDDRRTRPL